MIAIASQVPIWCLPVIQSILIHVIVGITAAFTSSRSQLRYITLLAAVALAYHLQRHVHAAFPSIRIAGLLSALCWAQILNAADILCLSRVNYAQQLEWERATTDQKPKESLTLGDSCFSWSRLGWALDLSFNLRRIGTPWHVKNLPNFDKTEGHWTSRLGFFRYRIFVICLALLTLRLLNYGGNQKALVDVMSVENQSLVRFTDGIFMQKLLSHVSFVVSYWLNMRATHQLMYNSCAVISVALGIHESTSWPPLGGSIMEAWTLRRFWGSTWHQLFRKLLDSNSTFISCSILRIPAGTLWARYSRLILAFLLSGVVHVLMDLARGIPVLQGGSIPFFTIHAVGIMAEDLATHIGGITFGEGRAWWKRTIGYLWVGLFILITTPMWSLPICRELYRVGERVPFLNL
ncbi:unnamed protein product [Penicillium olsonii]|nr:unnamed protein product [Penicillium olsonii]CAG7923108.1 unnamed protein product [Penicillium olsonii]